MIIQLFITEAEARPGLRVIGVDVERRVEVLDRRLILASRHQALATGLIWLARERVAINRIVEIGDRLNVVALALIDETAGVIGLGALGVQPDRLISGQFSAPE